MKKHTYESLEAQMKSITFDFSPSFTEALLKRVQQKKKELQLWGSSSRWMLRAAAAVLILFGSYAFQHLKTGETDALIGVEDISFYDWTLLEKDL